MQFPQGRRIFSSTAVKPAEGWNKRGPGEWSSTTETLPDAELLYTMFGESDLVYTAGPLKSHGASRAAELKGLQERDF